MTRWYYEKIQGYHNPAKGYVVKKSGQDNTEIAIAKVEDYEDAVLMAAAPNLIDMLQKSVDTIDLLIRTIDNLLKGIINKDYSTEDICRLMDVKRNAEDFGEHATNIIKSGGQF